MLGVKLNHILDESVMEGVHHRGVLAQEDAIRPVPRVAEVTKIGVDAVLVARTTISSYVAGIGFTAPIPGLKIYRAMIVE